MSLARSPRCMVLVNGNAVLVNGNPAAVECNIHQSIHQSADTFFATLPLTAEFDETFWGDTAPIKVELRGTNDINLASYTSMFVGQIDRPLVSFSARTVKLAGRDNTALLTDKKTTGLHRNKTDKDIIAELAQAAGLTVQFNGTPSSAGLQFDQDFTELADSDTSWNMIVALARKAGCIAFVKGTVLYVQPIDASPPNGFVKVTYRRPQPGAAASSNAVSIMVARNLHLAKDMTATVQTVRHKQGDVLTSSYNSKPKMAGSDKIIYQHRAANLTKHQQDRIARSMLTETLSHEREVVVSNFTGDVNVVAGTMGLTLAGTRTAWDQDYILSDVVHRFNNDGGYMMDLTAHSQDASRGEPTQLQ